MDWSYILFLPAAVSVFWAVAILMCRRRIVPAHIIFSLTLIVLAAAMVMLAIYFRGHSGTLFIFHYLFECLGVCSAPLFFLGVCSLTEPRGITLMQRRVLLLPLLFIACLTGGALAIGWRGYEAFCIALRQGTPFSEQTPHLTYMYIVSHVIFRVLIVVMSFALLAVGTWKLNRYQARHNDYYADRLHVSRINSRSLVVLSWVFLPIAVSLLFALNASPSLYIPWIIALSVAISVLQGFIGTIFYRIDHDARSLADYIRRDGWPIDPDQ